ncbi:MAG: YggS family pyridoxal phosphate-dependent enzyme [Methylacidiphilales bacterium]|nr:YggS family pyridoxal phosphate-dependent enzyme [Candidatus Methylacidiphilales bacterium]MDW8348693.1 YggS family pyridoxal phosphate-dependent enzyme [Verrucomicrobiae bacterium]
MSDVFENVNLVRREIEAACQRSGREFDEVKIIAVTKGHNPSLIDEAWRAGLRSFGESKIQEAISKIEKVGRGEWHFIGHLQTNKVKWVPEYFSWVHSLDSEHLALELNQRCERKGRQVKVLVQVNVAAEATKYGVKIEEAEELVKKVASLRYLDLMGLMTIAPLYKDPEKTRPVFRCLRELKEDISKKVGMPLTELSMGMSNDYKVAIEEGATMVRLGTALFGARSSAHLGNSSKHGEKD